MASDSRTAALAPLASRIALNPNGTAAIELLPNFSNSTVRAFFSCAYVSYAMGNAAQEADLFLPGAADAQRGAFVLDGTYGLYVVS